MMGSVSFFHLIPTATTSNFQTIGLPWASPCVLSLAWLLGYCSARRLFEDQDYHTTTSLSLSLSSSSSSRIMYSHANSVHSLSQDPVTVTTGIGFGHWCSLTSHSSHGWLIEFWADSTLDVILLHKYLVYILFSLFILFYILSLSFSLDWFALYY